MFLRGTDKHGREAEKNLDLRVRKTRRAIRSGLVKACQAKPYAHVSVTDICAASMVSRTTFYDHYTDKDALLADCLLYTSCLFPGVPIPGRARTRSARPSNPARLATMRPRR